MPVIASTGSVIRDQRTMVGGLVHSTPESVEAAWAAWAAEHGFASRRRSGDSSRELRRARKPIQAYVSAGCWTADCPCGGGVPTWVENPRGCCLDCGTVYPVEFPPREEIDAAEEPLRARPEQNRHWFPHRGETAETLRGENITRGFHPTQPLADAAEGSLTVEQIRVALGDAAVAKLRETGALS